MTDRRKIGTYSAMAAAAVAALAMVSCGGGGGGSDEQPQTATKFDNAGAERAVENVKAVVPICTVVPRSSSSEALAAPGFVTKALMLRKARLMQAPGAGVKRPLAYTSTPPADTLGDCGGRLTYANYSHVNGVTTATMRFENYCTVDTDTGDRETVDGSISFVNTATPTPSGPITTKFEASSAGNLVARSKTSAGALVGEQSVSFSGFEVAVGVPGGTPTAASPNVMRLADARFTNTGNATYRESNVALTMFETAGGDTQMSLSGRGYRSSGEYFDYATTAPLVLDANGDYTGGEITFTGAEGTSVVVTLVPGPVLQATMKVNGAPLTTVPACR